MGLDNPVSEKARKRQLRKKEKEKRDYTRKYHPLIPKNDSQAFYMQCLEEDDQIFAIGAAGTGKTYIAARFAMKKLLDGDIEKIFVARPTVANVRHKNGFLPGNFSVKMKPWFIPISEAFKEETSPMLFDKFLNEGKIEQISFEYIRGRTFHNSFVILDEAQNCTLLDLKTFLTRIGENTKVVVCGDMDQTDIQDSGLRIVVDMIEQYDIDASICEFLAEDVVRSKIAKEWVSAFSKVS